MSRLTGFLALAVLVATCAACLAPASAPCADGTYCPADRVCIETSASTVCGVPADRCDNAAEGTPCAGDGPSACTAGVCTGVGCGDGQVNATGPSPEQCDDGSANSDVVPGACRSTCVAPYCGDGVLDPDEQPSCHGALVRVGEDAGERLRARDLDGDGLTDLISTGAGLPLVVFYGRADGGTDRVDLGIPATSGVVDSGDFDGDGRLDLAVLAGASVSVRLATGARSYGAPVVTPVTGSTFTAVELSGDDQTDLVVAGDAVRVLLAQGDGSFQLSDTEALAGGTFADLVVAGEIDGVDGTDVLVFDGFAFVVLAGDGLGGLQHLGETDVVIEQLTQTQAGDLDDDGLLDVAFLDGSTVSVLLADGEGGFRPVTHYSPDGQVESLASGDLDADGDGDLVAAASGPLTTFVLRNTGSGGFVLEPPIERQFHAATATLGPLADGDRDGQLDLVVLDGDVWRARGGDGPVGQPIRLLGEPAYDAVLPDLDGDGRLELVLATFTGVTVGRAAGVLVYQQTTLVASPSTVAVAACRLDEVATDQELVVATTTGVTAYDDDGTGGLVPTGTQAASLGYRSFARCRDVDGDGVDDVILFDQEAQVSDVVVFRGMAGGALAPGVSSAAALGTGVTGLDLLDVGGDGRVDLLIADGDLRVHAGQADGSFAAAGEPLLPGVISFAVADVNGDGRADIVTVGREGEQARLEPYLAQPQGGFVLGPVTPLDSSDGLAVFADLDGDQALDLVAVAPGGGRPVLWIGDGSGAFVGQLELPLHTPLAHADLTGDGREDLVAADLFLAREVFVLTGRSNHGP